MMKFVMGVVCAAALAACGGSAPAPNAASNGTSPASGATGAPSTFADQVALGQKLYGEKCAFCHGASGEGNVNAPAVVGVKDHGALPLDPPAKAKVRKTQFKTVADVADFVVKAMPPKAPGSLSADEYWAILAFDSKANGIDLADKKLDPTLAATLNLH
jgi:cytochrome c